MAKLKHLELPNGSNYDIYGVNVQEISYDDYESLTPTQKNSDIAYCITDTPYEVDDSIYGEASGTIASFDNGSANPLKSLVVDINPVQDLHGYDKPWAGGAGKNKLVPSNAINTTLNGITFKTSGDGVYEISGTATAGTNCEFTFSQATSLVSGKKLSFFNNFTGYNLFFRKDGADKTYYNFSSANRTVTIAAADAVEFDTLRIMVESGATINGKFALMMYEGDTTTTYEPYSNICPISGWSSVEVTVTGTNVWDEEWESGYYKADGSKATANNQIRTVNKIAVKPNATYYFRIPANGYNAFAVVEYDAWGGFLRRETPASYSGNGAQYTTSNDCYFININIGSSYGASSNNDISINYPSTDTSYHPYNSNGTTTTINLGQTVYGGKLNVTTGELTVDRAYLNFDGSSSSYWRRETTYGDSTRFDYTATAGIAKPNGNLIGNYLSKIIISTPDAEGISLHGSTADLLLQIHTDRLATDDVSGLMGYFTNNPLQIVYELATPTTISLTPTQVSSLLGSNNIWADGGDSDVVYITSDFIYNELRMNDTVIASNSFAYHSIESESATMAGHANTASNAQTVNGHTVNSDVPSNATFTDTTYTFANGTNGFTVTPSGGTAQTVTVTPSITNNVTGSGTSGYLAKFNGANTITNGAQLGSDTTKFLRNDGTWAVPPGAGGGVTGVKGNAESTYRTGNVNLTPANLGLESKPAASGGTDLSLVTTHEKYVWNNKATTDENVKQTQISTSINNDYPILGGYPYDTSSPHIRGTYYSDDITITGHSLIIGATGASAAGYNSLAIGSGGTYESQLCAGGDNSIAVGEHVCSSAKNQVVFGRWNREDPTVFDTHQMGIRFDHGRNSSEGQYVEIVGNGTSYQNTSNARTLDWSGNEWLAGTLTASGATINGSISASGSISVSENILSDDSSLDITTSAAPSSDYWSLRGIYLRDTNQIEFGRVRGYYLSDGEVGVEYETKRTVGGTVKYNNLNLGIDSSGNNVVSVSSPSAWRTALGLKDWVEVDHQGGTTPIAIPSGTTEICCVITVGNNTIAWTFTLPYAALSSTSWRYTNAYTSVSDGYIAVNVSTAQVSLNAVYNGKSNVTNSSILYLYAR